MTFGRLLALVVLAAGIGCGGALPLGPEAPAVVEVDPEPPRVDREPIRVEVSALRTGSALRLEITGIGRGHEEGEAFENPERWTVQASVGGAPLKHIVNGSVKVDRQPVGHAYGTQWNVFVHFSVAFAIDPAASHVDIRIQPPGAEAHLDRLEVSAATAARR